MTPGWTGATRCHVFHFLGAGGGSCGLCEGSEVQGLGEAALGRSGGLGGPWGGGRAPGPAP